MKCLKCNYDNREEAKFCKKCGDKLERICPSCNYPYQPGSDFCDECGYNLKRPEKVHPLDLTHPQSYTPKFLADKILTTRSSLEGERKLVTVLFADVADFTSLSEKLDPEEVHQIMDGCFKILMDEIHKFEGTINQFTGDGVMALFGAPIAHEDHAQRACYAALSIQKGILEYGKKLKKARGIEFSMRIGLNSGPVIVGSIGDDLRMDYTAIGDTTNLADRIQNTAKPGQVLMSQKTRIIVQDYFLDEPLGKVHLKGKSEPHAIYCLIAEREDVHTRFEAGLVRGITALVGRRPEMEVLQNGFESAKNKEAQIIDVIGEAGVGKSRLLYEFRRILDDEVTFLTGTCIQYGKNINFLPLIDIIKRVFDIKEGMTEEESGNLIVKKATGSLVQMIPFYRNLLSLKVEDPSFDALESEGRKFATFEAVKNLLIDLSKKKPLVIFLEDVHWIDKISEDFFTYFSRCIPYHPILMISAYRPEGNPQWAQGEHYHRLGIKTLSSGSSIRLMHNILGGMKLDPALEKKIVEKTGGNPFFVEEIVRELVELGHIQRSGNQYICNRPIDQLQIPGTIQGVLAARMDRLSEDLKKTMQVASVIGRDFAFRILKSLGELGKELKNHLSNLVGLEIIYEKALYPELEYIFKHALTQEVAYDSLLRQKRQKIHGRIAQAIEELYAGRLEEHLELLAHHYTRSENAIKAVEYLILAGEKSNKNNAAQSARDFFQRALELSNRKDIKLNPDTEVRLNQGWATASLDLGAIFDAVKGYKRSIEISQKNGMIEYERESIIPLALSTYLWPDRQRAEQHLEEFIIRARELKDKNLEILLRNYMAINEFCYGSPQKAHKIFKDIVPIAQELDDFLVNFYVTFGKALLDRWLGKPGFMLELTEDVIESMADMFDFSVVSTFIFWRGVTLAEVGRIHESIGLLKYWIDVSEKFGPFIRHGSFLNTLGYCYSEIHQHELALKLNMQSEACARELVEKYPMGRLQYAEIAMQAGVNLVENLFDQGKVDEAWKRMESYREESRSDDFNMVRKVWETRMDYVAAQILLHRNEIDKAEIMIESNLDRTRENGFKKREGCFLRLMGEVEAARGNSDNAINHIHEAIVLLKEVGNPRQHWQAYASLASVYEKAGRSSEAENCWGEAAEIIFKTADGLKDANLREGFLNAEPIQKILLKSER